MIGNLCWIHINGKKVLVRVPESWNLKTKKMEQEITLTKVSDEKALTEREQQRVNNLVNEAKRQLMAMPFEVPKEVMENIPKFKHDGSIDAFKMDVVNLEIEKAREKLIKLNSPSEKLAKQNELWLNHRNIVRQLGLNMMRAKLFNAGQEVKDSSGRVMESWEVFYLIDKLSKQIEQSAKELQLFGLKEETVLENL